MIVQGASSGTVSGSDSSNGEFASSLIPAASTSASASSNVGKRHRAPNVWVIDPRDPVSDAPSGKRILIADDNKVNIKILVQMLIRLGYRNVKAAEDGQQAVDAFVQGLVQAAPFHLVLMDCIMPNMDGLVASRTIRNIECSGICPDKQDRQGATDGTDYHRQSESHPRKIPRKVPICALTANSSTQDREDCIAAGMDDFVTKPLSIECLRIVLKKWLQDDDHL
jgi:CheY-like chemotaxis protein